MSLVCPVDLFIVLIYCSPAIINIHRYKPANGQIYGFVNPDLLVSKPTWKLTHTTTHTHTHTHAHTHKHTHWNALKTWLTILASFSGLETEFLQLLFTDNSFYLFKGKNLFNK